MPSLISMLLREQIRLLKPIFTNFSVSASRSFQEALGRMGAKVMAGKVNFTEYEIGRLSAALAEPVELPKNDDRIVLYLHGGGYVAGSVEYARGFAGVLSSMTGLRVLCIAYRLAPENPFPAALNDSFEAYNFLLRQGYRPNRISFIGESAGGGLVFALCLLLKSMGKSMPSRIVTISPWTDLTMSGNSYETNQRVDISLTRREISGFVEAYAPNKQKDPLVSPVLGDLRGLPPCRIYVGGDEILLDDSVIMAKRLEEAGVPCVLTVAKGMWHGYVLYGVPEAHEALAEIKDFFKENLDEK